MDLERLATVAKTIDRAREPTWQISSHEPNKLVLDSVSLEIDYVTEEGLFLDAHCLAHAPDLDVTFVLTVKPASGLRARFES